MKKLTAGIFTVLLGLVAANSADAAVASKGYVDEKVGVNTTAIGTLSDTVDGHTQSIAGLTAADTAINAKIGTVDEGKTLAGMIADAKQEAIEAAGDATYNDTEVRGLISNNAGAITALELKVGDSSVADQIDAVRATTIAGLQTEQRQTMFPTVKLTEEMIQSSTNEIGGSVAQNTTAIQDINNSDVMKSGITPAKVTEYDGYGAKITANETAAADAQAAAEAAQADANENAAAIAAINNSENGLLKQAETAAKAYADGLAGNYDAKGAAAAAETAAKSYADSLAGNYDAKGAAAAAETAAKAYADGLADNYDAKGAAAAAETAAKSYADGLAGNYDAKGAAEAAETAAVATAKGYTDTEVKKVDDKLADYALKSTIGEVESGKTVVQMISEAKTAATYDDTEVRGLIGANKTATETNAEAIKTINEGAVMTSGITADKVSAYDAYAGTIAANTAAAEAAQADADAAQKTADNAIPKPTGECANANNKCVLTFNNAQYAWEVIERNADGE